MNATDKVMLVASLLALSLPACSELTPSRIEHRPSGEGYGTINVAYQRGVNDIVSHVELYHWDKTGKSTLIWPALYLLGPLDSDAALFLGYLIHDQSEPVHAGRRGPVRLFAVRGTGPIVDITDDVHLLWLPPTEVDLSQTLASCGISDIRVQADRILLRVYRAAEPGKNLEVTREQILTMFTEGKEKGQRVTDPGTGTPYFKRDREAELRKRE